MSYVSRSALASAEIVPIALIGFIKARISTSESFNRYGMVRFLLFSEYISSREEKIYENKRKRNQPVRLKLSGVDIDLQTSLSLVFSLSTNDFFH